MDYEKVNSIFQSVRCSISSELRSLSNEEIYTLSSKIEEFFSDVEIWKTVEEILEQDVHKQPKTKEQLKIERESGVAVWEYYPMRFGNLKSGQRFRMHCNTGWVNCSNGYVCGVKVNSSQALIDGWKEPTDVPITAPVERMTQV
jgi:hypothetical protein